MKVHFLFLVAVVSTLASCKLIAPTANVTFSKPKASNTGFMVSTREDKALIVAGAPAAQNRHTFLEKRSGGPHSNAGIGNAFVVMFDGTPFLCTELQQAAGLGNYTARIGVDMALVDFLEAQRHLKDAQLQTFAAYDVDTTIRTGDRIVIKGYVLDRTGRLQAVTIKGKGELATIDDYPVDKVGDSDSKIEYTNRCILLIGCDIGIDLGGLVGAPAFNQEGNVVGMYSGRLRRQSGNAVTHYLRISLFY